VKPSTALSLVALVVLTLAGVGYLTVGVLDMDPRRTTHHVTVRMDTSGGLMDSSAVTSRGIHVGSVERISVTPGGLEARIALDAGHPVAVDSDVYIANLSAAGEQYIDIRPRSAGGPYLTDGDVIESDRVIAAATVSEALAMGDALAAQLDANALTSLAATATEAVEGRDSDIDRLVETFGYLAATLRDKSTEIENLYDNAQQVGRDGYGYGPVLTESAPKVGATGAGVAELLESFNKFSYVASDVWVSPLGPLVEKIDGYLTPVTPDMALIAALLKPYTEPIKPLRFDAGSIVDVLNTVFPPGGPAKLSVEIPN
jgi:phospholipid/cholesterol/gamma-HCH transport system substrate-binding protein